jgi:SpoVK/Ycf46/Vps4 family AAA+-type ATPase
MKSIYFNEREKRLYNFFSKKNDYYKDCYLGETKPILDRKIKHLEKQMLDKCKAQLKVLKKKDEREELQRFINLFEEPKNVGKEIIPETNKVVEEQFIKKVEVKKKDPFVFKTERSRVDYSRYVYWCNPFEPINKGKLGTTQGWRIEKPVKHYY